MTFVPNHAIVQAPGAAPTATALLVHGILGSSRNLRTLAVHLARATPNLQYVLVDLRGHGDSLAAPPPHTLAACAQDLVAVSRHLDIQPAAIIGHSFGGKVALAYARTKPPGLRQVWVLDATPDMRAGPQEDPHAVELLIAALHDVPQPLPSRATVVAELAQRGFAPEICHWMTTNVKAGQGGLVWRFDLQVIEEMLLSYFLQDDWPTLRDPPPGVHVDVVRAERSDRWTPETLLSFSTLPKDRVALHVLRDAGHWLHADNLGGLVALLAPSLRACR